MKYLLRSGKAQDFLKYKDKLIVGETVLITDRKTLGICFAPGEAELLKFDEVISEEKADTLIRLLTEIIAERRR